MLTFGTLSTLESSLGDFFNPFTHFGRKTFDLFKSIKLKGTSTSAFTRIDDE